MRFKKTFLNYHLWYLLKSKNIELKKLGSCIKNLRKEKGLTQIEVSARMGKDQQSLQRVESGNINPSYYYLLELAEALELNLESLLKKLNEADDA